MVNNLFAGTTPVTGVGADPLAQARNHVSSAGALVGTPATLFAISKDVANEMSQQGRIAGSPIAVSDLKDVQTAIDQRVAELRQTPIQKADGTVAPMTYDTAQRLALEQIGMELRTGGVY